MSLSRGRQHLIPIALFAGLAMLWTYPLILRWHTDVPGDPGDNYLYLWNVWWMRHALASDTDSYFRSMFLFVPLGVDLVNQSHSAMQTFIAATVMGRLSGVEAQNLGILASVFANAMAAYALAFDITGRQRTSVLAGVIFGGSPYITAHLMGHFDLVNAWVLPLFALCFRRALARGSAGAMISCGVVLCAAAYTAYYYVVYLGLFAASYLIASWQCLSCQVERRQPSRARTRWRRALVALLLADAVLIAWIAMTGGGVVRVGPVEMSARAVSNPLTGAWVLAAALALTAWRPRLLWQWPTRDVRRRGVRTAVSIALVFAVGASPLIVAAWSLAREGRYVSQTYLWRSAPRGIDVAALVSGPPFHPVTKRVTEDLGRAFGFDRIEGVAWLGVTPLMLLAWRRRRWTDAREASCWLAVLGVSFLWALGPRLTVAGFDAGLPLPQTLAWFVPIVSNARVPGRAMVLVYLSLGMLTAMRLGARPAPGRRVGEWAIVGLVTLEYLGSPLPMTRLPQPGVYRRLAAIGDGQPVCEVPFGVGDGLGGSGDQAREILYFATLHGHPLVGGFAARMPPGVADEYAAMPVVAHLLSLSGGPPAPLEDGVTPLPCRYMVVNLATASAALQSYVHSALTLQLLAAEQGRELYAVRPGPTEPRVE